MYDLIDRPVALMAPGGRFLLWAMRGWIQSASKGHCPPGALAPAFARHGVLPALPHFHTLLVELNHRAIRQIAFSPLPCGVIGEDEAVLLQLCRDARTDPPHARATLALLVEEEAVDSAFSALLSTIARLNEAGLDDVSFAPHRATGLR